MSVYNSDLCYMLIGITLPQSAYCLGSLTVNLQSEVQMSMWAPIWKICICYPALELSHMKSTIVVNIKCLFVILDIMPTFGLTFKVYEHHTSSNRSAVLCINNIQSCFFCCQNGTYWVPSLAEIWTQKHILDKLAEMRRLLEVKRKTSVSVEHMQVFEYLTLNCLLQMVHILCLI